jgi:hypothetical protein
VNCILLTPLPDQGEGSGEAARILSFEKLDNTQKKETDTLNSPIEKWERE